MRKVLHAAVHGIDGVSSIRVLLQLRAGAGSCCYYTISLLLRSKKHRLVFEDTKDDGDDAADDPK